MADAPVRLTGEPRVTDFTLLASADWIHFAFVRDRLGLSDSALSKQN